MKKKITALLLGAALTVTSLVGCGNDASQNEAETTETQTTEDDASQENQTDSNELQADGEPVQLTGLVVKNAITKSVEEMQWMQDAEAKANVDITWQEVPRADWETIKGTLISSGDIPDIIVGAKNFDNADFVTYDGLFEDMSSYINADSNIKKMFEEHPELEQISTMSDGGIYGIPKYQRFWPSTYLRMYINKDWLDRLGLEVPTTWDEFKDVLIAFRDEDANGDGNTSDEIPMDFTLTEAGVVPPALLLGSFGISLDVYDSGYGYYVDDGVVKNFYISEEYKKLVTFFNDLWNNGLINAETFTNDVSTYNALLRAREGENMANVGVVWGWSASDRFGAALCDQYVSMAPLKYEAGQEEEVSWGYESDVLNIKQNCVIMSAACENKDAAFAFIDELYNPETSLQILWGDLGSCIVKQDDGSYRVQTPEEAGDTEGLDAGNWKWTTTLADEGPGFISDSLSVELPVDIEEVTKDMEVYQPIYDRMNPQTDILHKNFLVFTDEDKSELSLIESNIINLSVTQFTSFVTDGNIEENWTSYCQNFENTGSARALEILQSAYDAYQGTN